MTQLEFTHSQDNLKSLAATILDRAKSLGASSAQLEINESIESSIDVLNSKIESFENSYDSNIGLSVFVGQNKGSIAISQVPPQDIDMLIKQALDIAKYTQADPHNGIANKEDLCTSLNENLHLYNPIKISNQDLINQAIDLENLGISHYEQINVSEGASISLGKYNFVIASTNGLNLGYTTTRYTKSLSLIGKTQDGMQTDYWYSSSRDFNNLTNNVNLSTMAAKRVKRRLKKGKIKSGSYPVIFEADIAKSLIGNFLGAISGGNLYRKLSFLTDSLGKQVFPEWINIKEDPFVIKGSSSCYFDNEGVKVSKRDLVEHGVVKGYLLSNYSARKMGMKTTGNAGGNHNIWVNSNHSGGVQGLAREMNKGLIIIETIGHGLNMVTGDYSVGASGLWVENGEIQFFVDNLTIAGNLKQIFKDIQYISDDFIHSSIFCGSIMVNKIEVSV